MKSKLTENGTIEPESYFRKDLMLFKIDNYEIIAEIIKEKKDSWIIRNPWHCGLVQEGKAPPQPGLAPFSLFIMKDQELQLFKHKVTMIIPAKHSGMVEKYIELTSSLIMLSSVDRKAIQGNFQQKG